MSTTPRCPDSAVLTQFVDRELTDIDVRSLRDHLAGCTDCGASVAAERRVKSAVADLGAPVPAPSLIARLAAIAQTEQLEQAEQLAQNEQTVTAPTDELADARARRERKWPTYTAAAASVAVFMVGGFAFLGASEQAADPSRSGTVAVVPAADRLTMEHAATTSQAGFGGPGFSAVSLTEPVPVTPAAGP